MQHATDRWGVPEPLLSVAPAPAFLCAGVPLASLLDELGLALRGSGRPQARR